MSAVVRSAKKRARSPCRRASAKPRIRAPKAKSRHTVRTETAAPRILTIGHSTRPIAEFIRLLRAHGVTRVVDVRTVPRSRHNPQFSRENLPVSLRAAGISYVHHPGLGGLRRPTPDSSNTGWRNLSFRGYADYMRTAEFRAAIDELLELARHDRLALMCAEAVPWRCHRSLIADALLVRGTETADISSATRVAPHRLTSFAKVAGTSITYPGATGSSRDRVTRPGRASAWD